MTKEQVTYIRNMQKEYEMLFNEKLHIDWKEMTKRKFDLDKAQSKFFDICRVYNIDPQNIINKKCNKKISRTILEEFSMWVIDNNYPFTDSSKIINRDKSIFSYYGRVNKERRKREDV